MRKERERRERKGKGEREIEEKREERKRKKGGEGREEEKKKREERGARARTCKPTLPRPGPPITGDPASWIRAPHHLHVSFRLGMKRTSVNLGLL